MSRFVECPLAVVGMGVRLPGISGLTQLWDAVIGGRCTLGSLPASRLDRDLYLQPGEPQPGKSYSDLGGTVPDSGLDVAQLGLSEAEAELADPAHLWFLQVVLETLDHAGIEPGSLAGSRTGIFVGHSLVASAVVDLGFALRVESLTEELDSVASFASLARPLRARVKADLVAVVRGRYSRDLDAWKGLRHLSSPAALTARRLRTSGPYVAVDGACASSLSALDMAARAIHSGRVEAAIVGGCSRLRWSSLVHFSAAQALSATGCFPFDARASGFVPSDGYTAVLVEPLERAHRAGRQVLAVIRGLGASCDGRGRGLWAPLAEGQVLAMQRAYEDGIEPASVQAIEAHATGTTVGDAAELEALARVFGEESRTKIPIASVKGNIGHTLESAGLAGVVKMILAMRQATVPPSIGSSPESLHPGVDWQSSPCRVVHQPEPWPDRPRVARRCAVSSFGIGGLNHHLVLDAGEDRAPGGVAVGLLPSDVAAETIAVVGIGVVLPGIDGFAAFERRMDEQGLFQAPRPDRWEAELFGEPATSPDGRWRVPTVVGGFLDEWAFDWRRFKIPPRQVDGTDPLSLMLLEAAYQALACTGREHRPVRDGERTAVYVGTIFGTDFGLGIELGLRSAELCSDLQVVLRESGVPEQTIVEIVAGATEKLRRRFRVEDEGASFSSSTLATSIAKHFDLMGPCAALDSEEASGLSALSAAVDSLRARDSDLALCCAGQRSMDCVRFGWYRNSLRTADRPGFLLAEGAVVVALRRVDDARSAGEEVLAVIDEVFVESDPEPWRALAAVARRGRAVAAPSVVEHLGWGPWALGTQEDKALAPLCDRGGRLVSATSQVGMTQGAAALVGLVNLIARGRREGGWPVETALTTITRSGIGGYARVQVMRPQVTIETAEVRQGRLRTLRLVAATREDLDRRVADLAHDPSRAWQLAAHARPFADADRWRLVAVASDREDLGRKLSLVRQPGVTKETLLDQGILRVERPQHRPRLAFVFSGQGSHYRGMLQDAVEISQVARETVEELDSCLQSVASPGFAELCWGGGPEWHTWRSQAAVLVADVLLLRLLEELGCKADVVLGHSFGEIPALVAAGCWSVEQAIRATRARCAALDALGGSPGRLVATRSAPGELDGLVRELRSIGFVAPSIVNTPEQTVLAVAAEAVPETLALLEKRGASPRLLSVPQPMHSELLRGAQAPFRRALEQLELHPPAAGLISTVCGRFVADPEEILDRLVRQLAEPIDFVKPVRRAFEDGVRVFVEVGPKPVVTRLVRSILKHEPIVAIASDQERVTTLESLLRTRAVLEALGLELAPAPSPSTGVVPYHATRAPGRLAHEAPHFDATSDRRRHASMEEPRTSRPAAPAELSQQERLLVELVCEHTGYPAEIVNLDLDLEADLGIDSIRKAQLIGSLADRYGISMHDDMDAGSGLSRFVTLRDVARFVNELGIELQPAVAPADPPPPVDTRSQPAVAGQRSTQRWVMRASRAENVVSVAGSPRPLRTAIVGGGALAGAVGSALRNAGSEVSTMSSMDDPWADLPRRLVVLPLAGAAEALQAGEASAARGAVARVTALFGLLQRWLVELEARGGVAGAELVAVTRLGGDLGLSTARAIDSAGGAITGLLKALQREMAELRVGVVDVPVHEHPAVVANVVLAELGRDRRRSVAVGAVRQQRYVVAYRACEAIRNSARRSALEAGSAWVVSGGGRGVTALCARELGQRYGIALHLLGTTPADAVPEAWLDLDQEQLRRAAAEACRDGQAPAAVRATMERRIELAKNLAALDEAGVSYRYHVVDVTDEAALEGVLCGIRSERAPIRGILHGAGIEQSGRFDRKSAEVVQATLEVKVLGARNLLHLTRNDDVRSVVAFGSVSGVFGGVGQADYSCANELMAKLLSAHRRQTGIPCTTIHWPPWAEVGMATRPESRVVLESSGHRFMAVAEGVQHLVSELEGGLREAEVAIADRLPEEAAAGKLEPVDDRVALLDAAVDNPAGPGLVTEVVVDPVNDPFLRDHCFAGRPLLPAAIAVELMTEAAALTGLQRPVSIVAARFNAPLWFDDRRPRRLEVRLETRSNEVHAVVRGDAMAGGGELLEPDRVFASAAVVPYGGGPPARDVEPLEGDDGWQAPRYCSGTGEGDSTRQDYRFGPSMRALQRFRWHESGAWGELVTPDPSELRPGTRADAWCVAAALLDGCFFLCGTHALDRLHRASLPSSAQRLTVFQMPAPGSRCSLKVVSTGQQGGCLGYDLVLWDANGAPVFSVEGLHMVIVSAGKLGPPDRSEVADD